MNQELEILTTKLAEELKKTEYYKDILDSIQKTARIGYWETDVQSQSLFWSDMTRQIHEAEESYSPSIEEGINFFAEGKSREAIINAFTKSVKEGENYDLEVELKTAKGNHLWTRAIGISEFENGKCKRVYGLFQDIDESFKRRVELHKQKELFRRTFEHAPNGMAIVGLEGEWLEVNNQVCSMLSYSKEELSGMTFQDITHPEDLELDLKLLDELTEGKRESYQMEKRYYDKYKNIVWAILGVSMIKDHLGNPLHFISQLTDITEKKKLLETTLSQNERLLNFAHIVSHNLRSHTSNFSMLLSMMKIEHPGTANNDYHPMLVQSSEKLQETLSYLNQVVAMQQEVEDNTESLSLYDYITKVQVSIQAQIDANEVELVNEVPEHHMVEAIPAYLESIILNFLTNAIKYRAEGRKPQIYIASEENLDFITFSIKDNGIGIDLEKNGRKLFGMYKTFHRNKDARGVGLFITRNQIEALGGRVEVESEVDKGTTFRVFLRNPLAINKSGLSI